MSNRQLSDETHKPIIRKFKRRNVYSSFKENIWGAHLADMQLISKCNEENAIIMKCSNKSLLWLINIITKYALIVLLNDKNGIAIVNAFQSILNDSERKPNKI